MDDFIETLSPSIPYSTLATLKDEGTDISKAGKYARGVIEEYFENGIVHKHSAGYKLQKSWRINRPKAEEIFYAKGYQQKKRLMLWHGTKAENVVSILKNGFLITASQGGMFGRGIYFADRASKSIQYCGQTKVLFLCEVAVGNMYCVHEACSFVSPPMRDGIIFDSVKGVGNSVPDPLTEKFLGKAIAPTGRTVKNEEISSSLLRYNEYIIYDDKKILLKYIVTFGREDSIYTFRSTINTNTYRPALTSTTNRKTYRPRPTPASTTHRPTLNATTITRRPTSTVTTISSSSSSYVNSYTSTLTSSSAAAAAYRSPLTTSNRPTLTPSTSINTYRPALTSSATSWPVYTSTMNTNTYSQSRPSSSKKRTCTIL